MLRLILKNIRLLMSKKSFLILGVVAPAVIILLFSTTFGKDINYKVGVVDYDNNYISNEIIKTINNIDNVEAIEINSEEYELLLITHQIQLAVIINDNFTENIINSNEDEVIIKSISNSDVVSTINSIIKSKTEDLSTISKISDKDINKFKDLYEEYNENALSLTANKIEADRPSIENSIGIVIMIIFITGASISNFLIEDEENNTKARILGSGVSLSKYYISMIAVFYLLSCITSILYYILCVIFRLDFGMDNSSNFLVVLLLINLVSISLNLCIVSFTSSRYIASTVNILIVVPTCMISGAFWDFEVMPTYLKNIGHYFPQRWVFICLENLQKYNTLSSISTYLYWMVALSLFLFLLSLSARTIKGGK